MLYCGATSPAPPALSGGDCGLFKVYRNWIGTAAAEQTPSESLATTDDEDQENKVFMTGNV